MQQYEYGNVVRKYFDEHSEVIPQREPGEEVGAHSVEPIIEGLYPGQVLRQMQFEAKSPLIDGLLNEGETALFVGKAKVGKSRFTLQLTISVASGVPFLGFAVPTNRKVLYLDLENSPEITQRRSTGMESDKTWWGNVAFYCPQTLSEIQISLIRNRGLERLTEMVRNVDPCLLVVDTLRLAMIGGEENNACDILQALTAVSSLRRIKPRLAAILVHHTRKSVVGGPKLRQDPAGWIETASGHFALVGHTDLAFGIERETQDSGPSIYFSGVARNHSVPLLMLEDCQDLTYRRLTGEAFAIGTFGKAERAAWDRAKELGRFTFRKLEKESGIFAAAIASMLRKAQDFGLVDRADGYYLVKQKAIESEEGDPWCDR